MKRILKRVLISLIIFFVAILGLRYYLIVKKVDYPVNRDKGWNHGKVMHILPTVNHNRMLIKMSFIEPVKEAPVLRIGSAATVTGTMTDTEGRFWMFDAPGLNPDTEYSLTLENSDGKKLCDPWPLKTFPHPDSNPERVRILIYT